MMAQPRVEERRMRVLHFSNGEARGGAEEHMLTLLRGLNRRRFELLLACPPALGAQLPDLPADIRVTPWAPMNPWEAAPGWRLARFLRRERVDLVHAHLSCASRAVAPWARLAGAVMLETPHVREGWRRGWKRSARLDRAAGRLQHGYIAVSEANARYLREDLRLPADKIRIIRNGIDVARFAAPLPPERDPRPAHGIAPGELLLVCAARLEPQKGHSVLLQALAQLPASLFNRLRLVCLGDGSLREALRQQARALGLAERVQWLGFCAQIEHWLAVADIFVLPSFYEGLPLSAMEASAAGCPVVATAVDGTPEVVEHGCNGLLVPAADPPALAQALLRLGEDGAARRALGEAGRQRARAAFDQAQQIAATAGYYRDLLAAAVYRRVAQRWRVTAGAARGVAAAAPPQRARVKPEGRRSA
ncbi:MAG: glycosyltransferase [Terriglobales bacterium]